MDSNNGDVGGFSWLHSRRLTALTASGAPEDHIKSLRERGEAVAAMLLDFRAKANSLKDSARYSPSGLQQAIGELAAGTMGDIKRTMDASHLENNLAQHRSKLVAKAEPDGIDKVVRHLERQEVRVFLLSLGVNASDPLISASVYRDMLESGNVLAMEAMETWPLGLPLPPELVQQGQAQRLAAIDPLTSKTIAQLERLKSAMDDALRDALQELPTPVADPIAERAGPQEAA